MSAALFDRFPWMASSIDGPLSIAHRGASDYADENSRRAFELAAELDADMWEVDIRTSRDGVCVCHHDADLKGSCGLDIRISDLDWSAIASIDTLSGFRLLRLDEIIDLAQSQGAGIYIDAKDLRAVAISIDTLQRYNMEKAIVAAGDLSTLRSLAQNDCPYPLAVMVPPFADPFELARQSGADIIHLCWEHASATPQDLVTPQLIERAQKSDLAVVLWHEERFDVIQDLLNLPVLGICSNRPEMLKPYRAVAKAPIAVLAHRGAMTIAPENTLIAFECGFGQGFEYAEFDIRTTADGALVLMHDGTVGRTTDGTGELSDKTLTEIQRLDAGSWFDSFFTNTQVPTLDQFLALTATAGGRLFVEIKSADASAVLSAIRSHNLLNKSFFWSFDESVLRALLELKPTAAIMTRRKDYPDLETAIAVFSASIIEFDLNDVHASELEYCQRRGVQTMIAYTGFEDRVFRDLISLCPSIVNLDYPHRFKKIYRSDCM